MVAVAEGGATTGAVAAAARAAATAAEAAGPGEFSACSDRYTLASLATEVGAAYYLSVEPANHSGNSTARFVVRAATAIWPEAADAAVEQHHLLFCSYEVDEWAEERRPSSRRDEL